MMFRVNRDPHRKEERAKSEDKTVWSYYGGFMFTTSTGLDQVYYFGRSKKVRSLKMRKPG
jgi:hypothetical protein